MHIGYKSEHDGDWICPKCLDSAIGWKISEEM